MAALEPNDYLDRWLVQGKPLTDVVEGEFTWTFKNPERPADLFYASHLDWTLFNRWTPYLNKWSDSRFRWSTLNGPRWELDLDAVLEAAEHLSLTWELEITPLRNLSFLGAHYGAILGPNDYSVDQALLIEDQTHVISMDPGLSPVAASLCLWHELTHCSQAESTASSPWGFYEAISAERQHKFPVNGSVEYFNTWWEAEAFRNMDLHFEIGPLTRPA